MDCPTGFTPSVHLCRRLDFDTDTGVVSIVRTPVVPVFELPVDISGPLVKQIRAENRLIRTDTIRSGKGVYDRG